jgi:hypothetical protein
VQTDPLTGARWPDIGDNADVSLYIHNAVADLSPTAIPYFPNVTARNTAFAAWVAGGKTMREGLHCNVAGSDQVYQAGAWRGIGRVAGFVQTATPDGPWTTPVSDNLTRTLGELVVADPGFPYRLRTYGGCEVYPTGGARVDSWMDINDIKWDFVPGWTSWHKAAGMSPVFTGTKTLRWLAYRANNTGSWTSTSVNFYMAAEIVPS